MSIFLTLISVLSFGLLFIAAACFILGLIKPAFVKMPSRSRSAKVFSLATFTFLIVFIVSGTWASSLTSTNTPNAPQTLAVGQPGASQAASVQSDQQKLEGVANAALGDKGGLDLALKVATIDKDDKPPYRPAGAKFVTVDLEASSFFDKSEFISDSGTVSSDIMQTAFSINPNFYDVLVRFYGPTTDQYGNKKDSLLYSYAIDRPTAAKINWSGFDKTTMCNFLRNERNADIAQNEADTTYKPTAPGAVLNESASYVDCVELANLQ